jgi:hypothetical protein
MSDAAHQIANFSWKSGLQRLRPDDAWRRSAIVASPAGERIGWHDAEHFHFLPKVAYHTVAAFAREDGHYFGMKERSLRDALAEEGLLHAEDGRHTSTLRVVGQVHRVLRLRRAALEKLWTEK